MFCGNPGVLSLGHCSDTIMQTNVSAELRDSIYPLSNYINRSWIVTNGSWRGRRGKQHDEELERAAMHDCIFPSYFTLSVFLAQISPCAPFRNPPPPNNPKPPHMYIQTYAHTHSVPRVFFQPERLLFCRIRPAFSFSSWPLCNAASMFAL